MTRTADDLERYAATMRARSAEFHAWSEFVLAAAIDTKGVAGDTALAWPSPEGATLARRLDTYADGQARLVTTCRSICTQLSLLAAITDDSARALRGAEDRHRDALLARADERRANSRATVVAVHRDIDVTNAALHITTLYYEWQQACRARLGIVHELTAQLRATDMLELDAFDHQTQIRIRTAAAAATAKAGAES